MTTVLNPKPDDVPGDRAALYAEERAPLLIQRLADSPDDFTREANITLEISRAWLAGSMFAYEQVRGALMKREP